MQLFISKKDDIFFICGDWYFYTKAKDIKEVKSSKTNIFDFSFKLSFFIRSLHIN